MSPTGGHAPGAAPSVTHRRPRADRLPAARSV